MDFVKIVKKLKKNEVDSIKFRSNVTLRISENGYFLNYSDEKTGLDFYPDRNFVSKNKNIFVVIHKSIKGNNVSVNFCKYENERVEVCVESSFEFVRKNGIPNQFDITHLKVRTNQPFFMETVFGNLPSLKVLDLQNTYGIYKKTYSLPNLEKLFIGETIIPYIPSDCEKTLEYLSAYKTNITSLPDLPKLIFSDISGSPIMKLENYEKKNKLSKL